jgi:hypothetical protein
MAGYSDLRFIPRRIDIVGPREKGLDYVGMGNSQLKILEQQMALGGQTVGSRTVRVNDCVIECWKSMEMAGVKITTSGGGGEEEKKRKCFCACHVAIGYVQNNRVDCYDFTDIDKTYKVVICKSKYKYTLIEGAVPMGFTPYKNGQKVLVIFEPDNINDPYVPNQMQGCHMIKCRISNITESHQKYYELP